MPECLVNYRNNNTGALVNVHICNIDDEQQAIKLADNSILDDEFLEFHSFSYLSPDQPICF